MPKKPKADLPKPRPEMLGSGMARKAASALKKREAKRRKLLGLD